MITYKVSCEVNTDEQEINRIKDTKEDLLWQQMNYIKIILKI